MFGLTRKLDSLEKKLDGGFQRIEQKLDDFEKHLVDKLDGLDSKLKSFEQDFKSNVESLRRTMDSGFARCAQQSTLVERVARLEIDIERLKVQAKL